MPRQGVGGEFLAVFFHEILIQTSLKASNGFLNALASDRYRSFILLDTAFTQTQAHREYGSFGAPMSPFPVESNPPSYRSMARLKLTFCYVQPLHRQGLWPRVPGIRLQRHGSFGPVEQSTVGRAPALTSSPAHMLRG